MKLSDIKGERTLDVIAELVGPIASIASDKEAAAFFQPKPAKEGQTASEALGERMKDAVPALMKGHKDDIIAIMAAIKGMPMDEYVAQMNLSNVIGDLYELLTDEEFLAFLPSSEKTSG